MTCVVLAIFFFFSSTRKQDVIIIFPIHKFFSFERHTDIFLIILASRLCDIFRAWTGYPTTTYLLYRIVPLQLPTAIVICDVLALTASRLSPVPFIAENLLLYVIIIIIIIPFCYCFFFFLHYYFSSTLSVITCVCFVYAVSSKFGESRSDRGWNFQRTLAKLFETTERGQ